MVPTSIDLGLPPARRTELDFYGYNLDAGLVKVSVVDNAGHERDVTNNPVLIATPTHYLMTVNISVVNGVQLLQTDQQIKFKLNGGEVHSVNILAAPSAQETFSILNTSYDVDGGGGGGGNGPFRRLCPPGTVGAGLQGRSGDPYR